MKTEGLKVMSFAIEWSVIIIINTKTCNIFGTSPYGLNRMNFK